MAYDLPSDRIHTRIITGLDGMDYLIAMGGWYWNALDWMHSETDWKDTRFIDIAWRASEEVQADRTAHYLDNFVAEFTICLKYIIQLRFDDLCAVESAEAAYS